jgi:homotetrameric cytidine deaminase
MASVNVELKARDPDPAATAARCLALGAEDRGTLTQRDTYFAARRGRLKLREADPGDPGGPGDLGAELIAYRRADASEPGESRYVRAATADPAALREALDATLGTTVVVSKQRRLFVWENVRIHLDEVEGLGTFLEFEALVAPDGSDLDSARAKVQRLRHELDVADDALIAGGYSDLLLDGSEALLRAADAVMRRAHVPYSRFPVGAALRAASGAIYTGANVENAAYPQSQCAEASAIGALVAAGETAITAVAVVAERVEHCPPCGGCRQRLSEFAAAEVPVHLGRPGAPPHTVSIGELLPGAFGPADLEGPRG